MPRNKGHFYYMKYTILILLNATKHWLGLSREERRSFFENDFLPISEKFRQTVSVRLFDAEAFHSRHSDYLLIETTDLKDYYYFIEHLRDTKVYTVPYFEVNDIIVGRENAFMEFEANL